MSAKNRTRMIYVATGVAVLGLIGGYGMAAVLTGTNVNQTANFYQGGNSGASGYSSPTLDVATIPAAVSTCSTPSVVGSTSAQTTSAYLSSTSGGTVCTTGDFAEEFTFAFSATIARQFNNVTITTQVGAGAVQTNTIMVELGTGTSGAFTQTVAVFVDYGAVNPPSGGITVLDAVIH